MDIQRLSLQVRALNRLGPRGLTVSYKVVDQVDLKELPPVFSPNSGRGSQRFDNFDTYYLIFLTTPPPGSSEVQRLLLKGGFLFERSQRLSYNIR